MDITRKTSHSSRRVVSPNVRIYVPQEFEVVCDGDVCERRPVGAVASTMPPPQASAAAPAVATSATSSSATTSDTVEAAAAALAAADAVGVGVADASSSSKDGGDVGQPADVAAGAADAAGTEDSGTSDGAGAGADDAAGVAVGGEGGAVPSPVEDPGVAQLVSAAVSRAESWDEAEQGEQHGTMYCRDEMRCPHVVGLNWWAGFRGTDMIQR